MVTFYQVFMKNMPVEFYRTIYVDLSRCFAWGFLAPPFIPGPTSFLFSPGPPKAHSSQAPFSSPLPSPSTVPVLLCFRTEGKAPTMEGAMSQTNARVRLCSFVRQSYFRGFFFLNAASQTESNQIFVHVTEGN